MIRCRSELKKHQSPLRVDRTFLADVLAGLSAAPKRLSCKYFYDQRGSKLFDAICKLDEYYLTRCELQIMRRHARQMMAHVVGRHAMLVEYGSGSSVKTRLLLKHLIEPAAYVPVDISEKHLHATARKLAVRFPQIEVLPVAADFTETFPLPQSQREPLQRVAYFPGSTIGNFERDAAVDVLRGMARTCGAGGGALIGIDLQKNVSTIEAAYNDMQSVTAQFNLNLLRRINCELGGSFDLNQFRHQAIYDRSKHRVDIRLVSQCNQTVKIESQAFRFSRGETIQTEYSHKYNIEQFQQLAGEAGLSLRQKWTDPQNYFAVLYFDVGLATSNGHANCVNRTTLDIRRRKPR